MIKNMLLHFILCLSIFYLSTATANIISKPGCQTKCGDVTVPYPFGIGIDCFLDYHFRLTCNTSYEPPKLISEYMFNQQIYNISDSELRVSTKVTYSCYDKRLLVYSEQEGISYNAVGITTFSSKNKFTIIGCDDYAIIAGGDFAGVCLGLCLEASNVVGGQCSGMGCCQISIPKGLLSYDFTLNSVSNHSLASSFNKCGYGFLVEEGRYQFGGITDLSMNQSDFVKMIESTMPTVLDWVIPYSNGSTCSSMVNQCKGNSSCYDVEGGLGYLCKCNNGYEGNPYLGCQDINECDQRTNPCHGVCINTPGSYNCVCPSGSVGNGSIVNGCQPERLRNTVIIGVGSSIGVLLLVTVLFFLYKWIRKTEARRKRKNFFKRNGGLLLKQQQDADSSLVDKTIHFTSRELEKATDNFNENRVLGRGGQGTVYKGMLVDGRIVAVKKSKIVDESQLEQFINEVVILSQVNHRSVVKLLGCCLETDVPLLVSEFISNGTLYDRLHNETEEFPLSLNMRLQIATEVAGALAYLHSSTSIPIYHRDIKTSNILLDEKLRAKVSDFGTSRFVSIEQTHLTTLVKGTFGYLDPEYFQSSQFTEKSDVYSFGVVLVELLTREKSISLTRFGQNRSLATYFMLAMEEKRVMSIFDALVVKEGNRDDLLALANLAMRCLNLNGKYRPTMKEVASELETIRTSHIPAIVQTDSRPVIYGEDLYMLSYGGSSSTNLSFNDSTS